MSYLTIAGEGQSELVEKKSRFIGRAFAVKSEDEAKAHLERLAKEEWDASHHVYAYRIYKEKEPPLARFSDDREPSGTAGKQALMVLEGEDLYDTLVVVTRYFGGTLLGTGGLSKAYSAASKMALEEAGYARVEAFVPGTFVLGYEHYARLKDFLESREIVIESTDFTEKVALRALLPIGEEGRIEAQCIDLLNGQLQVMLHREEVLQKAVPVTP